MYHRILEPLHCQHFDINVASATAENFAKQIEYLSKRYSIISFDYFIHTYQDESKLPRNPLIITFDDGYKDNYKYAYPILRKFNVPATVFLTTGYIGNNDAFWWDKVSYMLNKITPSVWDNLKDTKIYDLKVKTKWKVYDAIKKGALLMDKGETDSLILNLGDQLGVEVPEFIGSDLTLTWDEIREMSHKGVSFGSHTVSHLSLANISKKRAEEEIVESKRRIEEELNKSSKSRFECKVFSYPYGGAGDFNEDNKRILQNNGFVCAATNIFGRNKLDSRFDLYELKRIGISMFDDMIVFKLKLSGIFGVLEPIINKSR